MKILHCYSDWKWTGPAEPVLQCCRALLDRGHDVRVAYRAQQQENPESVGIKVASLGLAGTTELELDRYLHPGPTLRDLIGIPRFLRRERFDIVHLHLTHDHLLVGLCARLLGRRRPVLVRTLHRREVLRSTPGASLQVRWLSDGCLTFTERFREQYIGRFRLAPDRVAVQPMPIDLERFRPGAARQDMRVPFGVPVDAPLIGIVGRYQRYRKMDVFLAAARLLVDRLPQVRFLAIGRSGKMRETVVEPMARLGLQQHVLLTGYRIGDYVDVMGALDVFTLLMPGFDGTARAVREALALGIPCVVSDFGMLPEVVRHGQTGLVVPMDDPAALAQAWYELATNVARRQAMADAARRDAEARFRIELVGPCLEEFYARLLRLRPPAGGGTAPA